MRTLSPGHLCRCSLGAWRAGACWRRRRSCWKATCTSPSTPGAHSDLPYPTPQPSISPRASSKPLSVCLLAQTCWREHAASLQVVQHKGSVVIHRVNESITLRLWPSEITARVGPMRRATGDRRWPSTHTRTCVRRQLLRFRRCSARRRAQMTQTTTCCRSSAARLPSDCHGTVATL